jgi:hypothetical protein
MSDIDPASKKAEITNRLVQQFPHLGEILRELHLHAPDELYLPLDDRDGAAKLVIQLPKSFGPPDVAEPYTRGQRLWELIGLFFLRSGRCHEASSIFSVLYDHLLLHQTTANCRVHKGVPLYWNSICSAELENKVSAKRGLMLTLCEDAIKDKGQINLEDSGSYFTLVWHFGLPDTQLRRYVEQVWNLHQEHNLESRFPEWCLQQLDQEWMTEFPNADESGSYKISRHYAKWLLSRTEDQEGKVLEILAQYLIGAMPGCRALRRVTSEESDYDVVGVFEGPFVDFRSELGCYFLVECKDWASPVDFTTVAKFCRVLDAAKCRFGILFSRKGVSGQERTRYAQRGIIKVFQDRGIVIIVITKTDLERVADGENFITMLRSKYEKVRLDLRAEP